MTVTTVAVAPPHGAWIASMAHHKRGKSRLQAHTHFKSMSSWPAWHDILHHSRPRRRCDKKIADDIRTDRVDADEAAWRPSKKPHQYYW